MIYYEVHENGAVLKAFRNAYYNDPGVDGDKLPNEQMEQLGLLNNMIVHGIWDGFLGWDTTGFEFPDEKSLTVFLLKWA